MGDTTDRLIALAAARSHNERPLEREMDNLLSTGEIVSSSLLSMVCCRPAAQLAISLTGQQAGIRTDAVHSKARGSWASSRAVFARSCRSGQWYCHRRRIPGRHPKSST